MNRINLLFFEAIVISILSFTYSIGWCSPTLPLPPPGTSYAQYWYTDYTLPFATIGFSAFGIFNIPSLNSSSGNLGIPNTFINYGSALSDFSLPSTSISLSSFATFNNFASSSPVTLNFSNTGTYNPIETYNIVTQYQLWFCFY